MCLLPIQPPSSLSCVGGRGGGGGGGGRILLAGDIIMYMQYESDAINVFKVCEL